MTHFRRSNLVFSGLLQTSLPIVPRLRRRRRLAGGRRQRAISFILSSMITEDTLTIVVVRCGQRVSVIIPILDAQYDPSEVPVRVVLGSPRVAQEVWVEDVEIYVANEIIDLKPDEDRFAIEAALAQLTDPEETRAGDQDVV